jgi:hypothetical protein
MSFLTLTGRVTQLLDEREQNGNSGSFISRKYRIGDPERFISVVLETIDTELKIDPENDQTFPVFVTSSLSKKNGNVYTNYKLLRAS